MKQTAVEYLLEYCERENWSIPNNIIEQTKEMEKEQIMDAYEAGSHTIWNEDTWMLVEKQEYYNETFKTNEK